MITRVCVVCGKPFECYPSENKVTCSKGCSREHHRRIVSAHPVEWGTDAKARASARGQTQNLKLGSDAARQSPISGRFETNQEAKIWTLISPAGDEIQVRNLRMWARENAGLFGKKPCDRSADQITHGFYAIAQTLAGNRGQPGKPRKAMRYFGWTLKCPPEMPKDK